MNSVNNDLYKIDRVSPFRYLRIKVCLPTPRSFSQASTSFIAFDCQGIHLLRLFTWFENPTRYFLTNRRLLFYFFVRCAFPVLMYDKYTPLLNTHPPWTRSKYLISILWANWIPLVLVLYFRWMQHTLKLFNKIISCLTAYRSSFFILFR